MHINNLINLGKLTHNFEGFSGNVKFDSNGDRAPASIMWNIFTFENNKVNMNHCSRDSDKDPYKVTFKSKSTTFKPYRPDCSQKDYNFSASCSDTSIFINELIAERK